MKLSTLLVMLAMPTPLSSASTQSCDLTSQHEAFYSMDGDILIGGTFPITQDNTNQMFTFTESPIVPGCQRFSIPNYIWLQNMVFAIKEINQEQSFLPNITLGFLVSDTCLSMRHAILGTLMILTGNDVPILNYRCQHKEPLAAIVADSSSARSISVARILGLFRYPQEAEGHFNLIHCHIGYIPSEDTMLRSDQPEDLARTVHQALHSQKVLLYLLIHCVLPESVAQRTEQGCQLHSHEVTGLSRDGDVILGGIFPLHDDVDIQKITFTVQPAPISCQRFRAPNYRALQAMVFAIEEINANPNILPNITIGFQIYDSCRIMQRSLEGTLWILAGKNESVPNFCCREKLQLMGVIGDAGSSGSIVMARVLGLYRFSQISYVSSSPILSDRNHFPSFFRTIPSDIFQSQGLAEILIHFGWRWVGLLAEDNDYGQLGATLLKKELERAGACIAFSENIILSRSDRNAQHIIRVIQSSTANVIVVFCSDAGLSPLIEEITKHKVTGKVWIASEGWSISTTLSIERFSKILTGTIGFAIRSEEIPGFVEHLNRVHPSRYAPDIFAQKLWEEAFGCQWMDQKQIMDVLDNRSKVCTGKENLELPFIGYNDGTRFRGPYNVYIAVYANAWALHSLISSRVRLLNGFQKDILDFKPWQLLHYVKNVQFKNRAGAVLFFSQTGEVPAQYDIVNWCRTPNGGVQSVRIGTYDSTSPQGQRLIINTSAIQWPSGYSQIPVSVCSKSCMPGFRKASKEGEPVCCFLCISCPPGEISNQTGSTECFKCPWDQWPNARQDGCILKTIEFLSYDEPLGSCLTAICIFCSLIPFGILQLFVLYRNTPIVKANNRSLSYLLLLSLSLSFLCSLAFIGYPTSEKCLLRQATFGIIFALCVSCILSKTIMVVIAFNATKPNSDLKRWVGPKLSYLVTCICTLIQVLLCLSWLILSPPFSENNIHVLPGKIIIECNEGSQIAFWCMLGYLGLLATNSFIIAFLARKLPDSFNEAKFITFSMLAFLSVWVSFIPAYLSTKGKYMVAMEVFAILTSSSALVSCIFIPKCYIILFRPQMNTKEYLMGKTTGHVKKGI